MILYSPENAIAFNIFGINIYWYGLIMSFSIFIGIVLSSYLVKKHLSKKDYSSYIDTIPVIIIAAIIGARAFYVIGDWKFYSKHMNEIILVNHGGLSIYGAIIFAIICLYYYSKKLRFDFFCYSDFIAVVMPLCQAIGRWGNFINQEAYGIPYNGIIKLYISAQHRYLQYKDFSYYYPAFLYESILNFLLFLVLLFVLKKIKNIKSGTIFALYLIFYSIIRLIIENYRIDSVLSISGHIHIASIISIIILIAAITLLSVIYRPKK